MSSRRHRDHGRQGLMIRIDGWDRIRLRIWQRIRPRVWLRVGVGVRVGAGGRMRIGVGIGVGIGMRVGEWIGLGGGLGGGLGARRRRARRLRGSHHHASGVESGEVLGLHEHAPSSVHRPCRRTKSALSAGRSERSRPGGRLGSGRRDAGAAHDTEVNDPVRSGSAGCWGAGGSWRVSQPPRWDVSKAHGPIHARMVAEHRAHGNAHALPAAPRVDA